MKRKEKENNSVSNPFKIQQQKIKKIVRRTADVCDCAVPAIDRATVIPPLDLASVLAIPGRLLCMKEANMVKENDTTNDLTVNKMLCVWLSKQNEFSR